MKFLITSLLFLACGVLSQQNDCSAIMCAPNRTCKNGNCIPDNGYCDSEKDCNSNEICADGNCEDACIVIRCMTGTHCEKGKCRPN